MHLPELRLERLEDRSVPSTVTLDDLPSVPTIDADMQANLQAIYQRGQQSGNRAYTFAKAGDSHTSLPGFLDSLGSASYNPYSGVLGEHVDLAPTVLEWRSTMVDGTGANSFNRVSTAAQTGLSTQQLSQRIGAELSALRPSVVFVMAHHNDLYSAELTRFYLESIVQQALAQNVIPVLVTPHDPGMLTDVVAPQNRLRNNEVVGVAEKYNIPLINYWREAIPLYLHGTGRDPLGFFGVHPSNAPTGSGDLTATGLQYGNNTRNLLTLETLEKLNRIVFQGGTPDQPDFSASREWVSLRGYSDVIAVGSQTGTQATVSLYDSNNSQLINKFFVTNPLLRAGANVTTGDINGDGVIDIITALSSGQAPLIQVYDGDTGAIISSFFAYESTFQGGVNLAVGDVDGDGELDIITGPQSLGGPLVKAFHAQTGEAFRAAFAFDPSFRGGVHVGTADLNGDGRAEIVTGASQGGAPIVTIIGDTRTSFFAFDQNLRTGVYVTGADLDGDGVDELVIGAAGAGPHVRVLDGRTLDERSSFFAGSLLLSGARVTRLQRSDGVDDLIVASRAGTETHLQRFDGPTLTASTPVLNLGNIGPYVG